MILVVYFTQDKALILIPSIVLTITTFLIFLIGGVFCDDEKNLAIGRYRIRMQIVNSAGITPYGIIPSIPYTQRQKAANTQDFWSRSQDLMKSLC